MHHFIKFFRNLNIRVKLFGGYSAIFSLGMSDLIILGQSPVVFGG